VVLPFYENIKGTEGQILIVHSTFRKIKSDTQ
jgi:hypothetical protein